MIDLERDDYAHEDLTPGTPVTYRAHQGYLPALRRPAECRWVCHCGECDGLLCDRISFVERLIDCADNSVVLVTTDGMSHTLIGATTIPERMAS